MVAPPISGHGVLSCKEESTRRTRVMISRTCTAISRPGSMATKHDLSPGAIVSLDDLRVLFSDTTLDTICLT
jgi:hypothetical protein